MNRDSAIFRNHALLLFALFALTLLAYANSFQTGFPLDNRFLILEDPRLAAATSANLNLIFTQDYCYPQVVGGVYRPVATLTYLFNYAILGSRNHPASYHWVNIALHWLTIGMFSKESTIVVLAVMVIYDVTFWNETAWRSHLPGYLALAPPLLLFWQVREHLYHRPHDRHQGACKIPVAAGLSARPLLRLFL